MGWPTALVIVASIMALVIVFVCLSFLSAFHGVEEERKQGQQRG